ncbi:MAG: hypothetical protein JXR76_30785 [Deltaproteobacteria bacterium]|nr:hypothetical protein [Deltaproteobacteria bacterium]
MSESRAYSNQRVVDSLEKAFASQKPQTITVEPKYRDAVQKYVEDMQDAYDKTKQHSQQFD